MSKRLRSLLYHEVNNIQEINTRRIRQKENVLISFKIRNEINIIHLRLHFSLYQSGCKVNIFLVFFNEKRELPDVQAGFRKGKGTRDEIANIRWIIEKSKRVPEKHLFLLY